MLSVLYILVGCDILHPAQSRRRLVHYYCVYLMLGELPAVSQGWDPIFLYAARIVVQ
jgi:hypothetical protein